MDAVKEEFFDNPKEERSSPKSAHNAFHKDVAFNVSDVDSQEEKKEDFGKTTEE